MTKPSQARKRIVISGMGLVSPCGNSIDEFTSVLKQGDTGIAEHQGIFEDRSVWAALVNEDFDCPEVDGSQLSVDRTARMGCFAAREAAKSAGLHIPDSPERVALTLGTSHGGRSQLDEFVATGSNEEDPESPQRVLVNAAHFQQTAMVASLLGIHGPTATLSNACSSSGAAIAYAFELLQSNRCDFAIAGGADGFSKLTFSGFAALGAVADGKCAPFSNPVGLSLGDGAAFVVLETLEQAQKRGAKILAEIFGYGLSWDSYHITAPEPSGEGMNRAIQMAVNSAGINKDEVDYVNVHGTGTRSNDLAETVGLQRFFDGMPPPVSATKSQTGHMLGASSVIGLMSGVVGMNDGWLPPTSNFQDTRSGCDLDVVPNTSRKSEVSCFLAQSAAFAGANAVLAAGKPGTARNTEQPLKIDDVVISGLGVVSSLGIGYSEFSDGVLSNRVGVDVLDAFDVSNCVNRYAGQVRDFKPRKLLPSVKLRRVDRVTAFATIASHLALEHANFLPLKNHDRLGLIAGLCRGAAGSYEKYLESVEGCQWDRASAVYFPNLVMSSVGGQVSAALGIKGITSTLVNSSGAGLHTLAHAWELFRRNPEQDAVVVVASDELSPMYFRLQDRLGKGPLGEGAVAFVLERESSVKQRGGHSFAKLCGAGLTRDGLPSDEVTTKWLKRAINNACEEAQIEAEQLEHYYGTGSGNSESEHLEQMAIGELFGDALVCESIHRQSGSSEAAMGMLNIAAAITRARKQGSGADVSKTLFTASGEDGSHTALLLDIAGGEF